MLLLGFLASRDVGASRWRKGGCEIRPWRDADGVGQGHKVCKVMRARSSAIHEMVDTQIGRFDPTLTYDASLV
eukprot:scaffold253905_cov33-Tisochrysis_lutea.AAC.3